LRREPLKIGVARKETAINMEPALNESLATLSNDTLAPAGAGGILLALIGLVKWVVGRFDRGFDAVHKRLDEHGKRVGERFDDGNRRFDKIDASIDAIRSSHSEIQEKVHDLDKTHVRLSERVESISDTIENCTVVQNGRS
jgi:hypothetical protein